MLSLRWLATAEPVKDVVDVYDADVLMLRVLEANDGLDPYAKQKRGKGKGGGAASPGGSPPGSSPKK